MSAKRTAVIFLVGVALGGLVVWQASIPIRNRIATRYVERGTTYLVAQEFSSAAKEYEKALDYNIDNQEAFTYLRLAKEGPVDIAKLKQFYQTHHVESVLDKLDLAQQSYETPKKALEAGVGFYEAHEYSFAQYPLLRAVQLDPEYPEAWHYLGLTYQELAKMDVRYQERAVQAFAKRDNLTPKYLKQ